MEYICRMKTLERFVRLMTSKSTGEVVVTILRTLLLNTKNGIRK